MPEAHGTPAPAEAASWRRVRRPRRIADRAMKVFCAAVTALGVFALGWILLLLAWEGLTAFSPRIFTEVTPGPGSEGGGLANAIVGSMILTFLGITVATPIGVLAGTYLSEYGKSSQLANVIRFVNDILLAMARIAGETAPLLFTALNNSFWFNASLLGGVANLPVTIFQFALSPYSNWQKLAWAGALLITVAILALSVVARLLVRKGLR